MRWRGPVISLLALAVSLALLPTAQAVDTAVAPTLFCGGPDATDCGLGCQIFTVNLLPPGAAIDEDCLPQSSPDSPDEAMAYADETAGETAEDAPT